MSRCGAVVEYMSKMTSAVRAMDLGSNHAEAAINGSLYGTLDRISEAGPTGPAFELTFCFEYRLVAGGA